MTYSFMEEIKKRKLEFDEETGEDLLFLSVKSGGYAISVDGEIVGSCTEADYEAVKKGDVSLIKRFGLSVSEFHAQMLHATVASNPEIIEEIVFEIPGKTRPFFPQSVVYDPTNKRLVVTVDSGY